MNDDRPLTYALRWRVSGVLPGVHRGIESGQSGRFREVVPFDRAPDPRRIDLRSTVRDPFGGLHVRRFEQRAAARVEILVDVSASMRFGLSTSHYELAIELVTAMARAAYEVHDGFGLALCADRIEFTRSARRVDPTALARDLKAIRPTASSAKSLIKAAQQLVGRRSLVFLVSDFAFPVKDLGSILDALALHDVVPVHILDDPLKALPRWGLVELSDLESGARRFYLMRPALRERWREQDSARRAQITQMCALRGRRPFVVERRFNPSALADHLLSA